jgi:hypothetical protein
VPRSRPDSSERLPLSGRIHARPSRRVRIASVVFGVAVGAYVSQKLRAPLGFEAEDDTLLFWLFFLSVMALLSAVFLGAALLLASVRRR